MRPLVPAGCWPASSHAIAAWLVGLTRTPRPRRQPCRPTIAVEDGHKPFLVGHAVGVQIYACTTAAGDYAWSSATPRARCLHDDRGNAIVTHFGGPSWEATDGSTVVGRRVRGVTVDPTAIPWLRLEAASRHPGTGRRPPRRHDVHPADRHDGRAHPARRGVQRDDRGRPPAKSPTPPTTSSGRRTPR